MCLYLDHSTVRLLYKYKLILFELEDRRCSCRNWSRFKIEKGLFANKVSSKLNNCLFASQELNLVKCSFSPIHLLHFFTAKAYNFLQKSLNQLYRIIFFRYFDQFCEINYQTSLSFWRLFFQQMPLFCKKGLFLKIIWASHFLTYQTRPKSFHPCAC